MMSEVFWTFFVSSMVGFIIAIMKMCYKSKCKEVSICCIKVIRDTEAEEKETEFVLTNRQPSPTGSSSRNLNDTAEI
jgi:hypothetical protein